MLLKRFFFITIILISLAFAIASKILRYSLCVCSRVEFFPALVFSNILLTAPSLCPPFGRPSNACKFGEAYFYHLGNTYKNLGEYYAQNNSLNLELALEFLRDAYFIFWPQELPKPSDIATSTLLSIARVVDAMNNLLLTFKCYEKTLGFFKTLYPLGNPGVVVGLKFYAQALHKGGRNNDAIRALKEASEIDKRFDNNNDCFSLIQEYKRETGREVEGPVTIPLQDPSSVDILPLEILEFIGKAPDGA